MESHAASKQSAGFDIKHLVYLPIGHVVLKIYVPSQYLYKPCKLMHTAGKISTCPDWKVTCPVRHITTKVYVPWDKIYMPQACGHALMSSPEVAITLQTTFSKAFSLWKCLQFQWNLFLSVQQQIGHTMTWYQTIIVIRKSWTRKDCPMCH